MATRSDELTNEIDATRGRMDRTLDDIGDRAGPGRLKQRMRGAVENTRDTIMGTAGDARDSVGSTAGDAADAVRERSQGNPLAAGLVAFGAGLLAGSILPESRTENRLAREVQTKAQGPVRDQLQHSAEEVGDRVGERAGEAKDRVVGEGRAAKDEVVGDAQQRADDVKEHARGAAEDVKSDVAESARRNTGQ